MKGDRVIVLGHDDRVIELTDQVRAERLARAGNAEVVRRRKDRKIVRIHLGHVSDDTRLEIHRGNPRRYSSDKETEQNPRGVWNLRRLPTSTEALYRQSVIDTYKAA